MNPKEACVYALPSIAVSIKGAGSSIPDMKTVEAFLQRNVNKKTTNSAKYQIDLSSCITYIKAK